MSKGMICYNIWHRGQPHVVCHTDLPSDKEKITDIINNLKTKGIGVDDTIEFQRYSNPISRWWMIKKHTRVHDTFVCNEEARIVDNAVGNRNSICKDIPPQE